MSKIVVLSNHIVMFVYIIKYNHIVIYFSTYLHAQGRTKGGGVGGLKTCVRPCTYPLLVHPSLLTVQYHSTLH